MHSFIKSPFYTYWTENRKWLFVKYILIATIFHILLRLLGFSKLLRLLKKNFKFTDNYSLQSMEEVKLLKKEVNPIFKKIRKSKYIWSNCLSSSILLWLVLKKQGLETVLVIGSKKEREKFKAHAWVEYNNIPLNENKKIRTKYTIFSYDFSE